MPEVRVDTPDGNMIFIINHHVDTCPHCGIGIQPLLLATSFINTMSLEIVYKCPRAGCEKTFIGWYCWTKLYDYKLIETYPRQRIQIKEFDPTIIDISPSFVQIYNEAYSAEQIKLLHISGMGYRKALEFLIKDYVITINPDSAKTVMDHKTTLNRVIKEFISDARIIQTAERASWLGNDETHYVRKWEDKDVNDLKTLIDLVIHWILMERLTDIYLKNMN